MLDDKHASLALRELEGTRRNTRIIAICWVTMIGPLVFLCFAILREGFFQTPYVSLVVVGAFVWVAVGVAALGWTILSFRKRLDSLGGNGEPRGGLSRARR